MVMVAWIYIFAKTHLIVPLTWGHFVVCKSIKLIFRRGKTEDFLRQEFYLLSISSMPSAIPVLSPTAPKSLLRHNKTLCDLTPGYFSDVISLACDSATPAIFVVV